MATVKGPLFSQKASGDFGKTIQFRCGKFVLLKPKIRIIAEDTKLTSQQIKFQDGARIWSLFLTPGQKSNWESFAKSVRHAKGWFTLYIPLGGIEIRIGEKKEWKECIQNGGFNGFQYFESCYLRFGPNGWVDYPNPPPFP